MTEKRLIDANAEIATIKENVCKNCNSYDGVRCRSCWVDDAISFLEDAPTIDAVEVVRCKDCKFAYVNSLSATQEKAVCNRCFNHDGNAMLMNADDFCSRGERRG